MLKGITHGACEYLVKPVNIKQVKNIWQHVVRKKPGVVNHISSDEDDACQRVRLGIAEDEQSDAKSKKCSKKNKIDGDDSDENIEITAGVANRKKPRVTWTKELQDKFVEVVKQLGIAKAVPKKILQMMNVDYLTRENVASHLQKYRLNLKRRNLSPYVNMYHQGSSSNYHEHQRGQPSSAFAFRGSNTLFAAPSVLGAHGVSIQSRNWAMGTVDHDGSMLRHAVPWLPDARRSHGSGPPFNSFAKTSGHIMFDAFPPSHSGKAYANILREKLLQASHPGGSFAVMENGGMLEPVNGFQVQSPEFFSQCSTLMNMAPSAVGTCRNAQFPCLVGGSSNPWQNVASSSFPGHMDGTPLAQSQNQMGGIINNNIGPVAGFSEQMAPFNMARNTAPVEMTNDNFSPMTQMVNGGSTTSVLPNLQADSSFSLTRMASVGKISSALHELQAGSSAAPTQTGGENAYGFLPMQEGPVDLRALDDQPIYSNPFFVDDSYANMLNQDLSDDAFFGGGC
ncbi:hypothetical protein ACQ4PT_053640 [Festuca glaucescens]